MKKLLSALWDDKAIRLVAASGTAVLAIQVLVSWVVLGVDKASRSAAVAVSLVIAGLVVLTAVCAATAIYQWRRRRELEQLLRDVARRFAPSLGEPIKADLTSVGELPVDSDELERLFIDARLAARGVYGDAAACLLSMALSTVKKPTIRVVFGFYSAHADRCVEVHWDNYRGMCAGHPKDLLDLDHALSGWKGWERAPWEEQSWWAKTYRLAFEKVQPVKVGSPVVIAAFAGNGGLWHFMFGNRTFVAKGENAVEEDYSSFMGVRRVVEAALFADGRLTYDACSW